jgi:hypothetical protein
MKRYKFIGDPDSYSHINLKHGKLYYENERDAGGRTIDWYVKIAPNDWKETDELTLEERVSKLEVLIGKLIENKVIEIDQNEITKI